jgi:steroid delta-isomerase-like uncharacterized protein
MNPSQLIQTYIDGFNSDDLDAMLSVLSDGLIHETNEGETRVGIEQFRQFKQYMAEHYDERLQDVVIMESGSRGGCEFVVNGVYKKTDGDLPAANGQPYAIRAAFFVDTDGGKITRITSYYNLKKWVEAVSA